MIRQVALVAVPAKVVTVTKSGQPQTMVDVGEAQAAINEALVQVSLNSEVNSVRTTVQLAPFGILGVIEFTTHLMPEGIPVDEEDVEPGPIQPYHVDTGNRTGDPV